MISHRVLALLISPLSFAAFSEPAVGGNLVLNSGFETGNFSGWMLSGNESYSLVTDRALDSKGSISHVAHGGNDYALLGPIGSTGQMGQTIATTSGQTYTFSWWLGSDGDLANEFSASWNGTSVFDQKDVATQGYVEYSFSVVATGSTTTIDFAFRNDPGYFSLDDVRVIAADRPTTPAGTPSVPEPGSIALLGLGILTAAAGSRRWTRRIARG